MQGRFPLAVAICVAVLTACSASSGSASSSTSPATAEATVHRTPGSLDAADHALALRIARDQQREVTGTFIGATAFISSGAPFDPGGQCGDGMDYLDVRLVWKADASFSHAGAAGAPADGPRRALIVSADRGSGTVCGISGMYRDVGASPREMLLYGEWPSRADG